MENYIFPAITIAISCLIVYLQSRHNTRITKKYLAELNYTWALEEALRKYRQANIVSEWPYNKSYGVTITQFILIGDNESCCYYIVCISQKYILEIDVNPFLILSFLSVEDFTSAAELLGSKDIRYYAGDLCLLIPYEYPVTTTATLAKSYCTIN